MNPKWKERGKRVMKIINLVEDTQGNNICGKEHGLSFYIETEKHKLLMDAGAGDLFLKNAEILGIDIGQVDILILSHGHYDHGGGIPDFVKVNSRARIYMKATAGADYYHPTPKKDRYIGIDKEIAKLPQCVLTEGSLEIDEELYLFSDITGQKNRAKGNLQLKKRTESGYIQDTFDHEQCLVIRQEGKHILLSGCAHNGILNILDRYMEIYGSHPDLVISGFHMVQKGEYTKEDIKNIVDTAYALKEMNTVFYTGHCTGKTAYDMMKEIMGEKLQAIHSGETII